MKRLDQTDDEESGGFEWGKGSDNVAVFFNLTEEEERSKNRGGPRGSARSSTPATQW